MILHYEIEFHSYWHCGSGLAAGADVDALVIKDKNHLPYIPGKTIKGLLKEAADEILAFKEKDKAFKPDEDYLKVFGYFKNDPTEARTSEAFFTNAELSEQEKADIVKGDLSRFLYESVSNTAIDKEGIAVDHSLRKIQVTVPCKLKGRIENVPNSKMADLLTQAMQFVKNMGVGRNKGLGRCTIVAKGGDK